MVFPASNLSSENIFRDVHDPDNQVLRVSATAIIPPGLEVDISAADGDSILVSDGTHNLAINADGSINIVGDIETHISHTSDSVRLGDGSSLVTTTTIGSDVGLDVNLIGGVVSGEFTPTGLRAGLRTQTLTVTDAPTKIPASNFASRNGMSIRIWGVNTVYFGSSSVTATTGYPKFQYEELQVDITDNVDIYAICETGKTCEVKVMEVA